MNYKGRNTYNTTAGGILTALTYLFIVNFLLSSFLELSKNENTLYSVTFENNLVENPRNLTFEEGDIQIASRPCAWLIR